MEVIPHLALKLLAHIVGAKKLERGRKGKGKGKEREEGKGKKGRGRREGKGRREREGEGNGAGIRKGVEGGWGQSVR